MRAKELVPRGKSSPRSPPFHGQRRSNPTPPEPTKNENRPDYGETTRWGPQPSRLHTIFTPPISPASKICYLLSAVSFEPQARMNPGERQKVGGQAALRSGSCVCGFDLNFWIHMQGVTNSQT